MRCAALLAGSHPDDLELQVAGLVHDSAGGVLPGASVRVINETSGAAVEATYQRSDVTSVPAASVVGEAMVALELARAFLEKFGGDTLAEVEDAWKSWLARVDKV